MGVWISRGNFISLLYKACAVSLYTILVRKIGGHFVTLFFNMSQNDLKLPNRILLIFSAIHIKSFAFRFATPTSGSMKDNGLKKVFQSFRTGKDRHIAKLRRRWQRLSYRQQRVIILYLLGLFAAIDLAYIVGGFCGTDKFPIEVRHLQRVMLPLPDSIQPLKNNVSNDTIR